MDSRHGLTALMPFLEGLPCSIHGFVFPEHTLALRPCEMLVFRRPDSSKLHYGRAATFWDPPAADREQMREVARRAGDQLRRSVGYRGAFTVDGVLTHDGFLPTELNPRFGAALVVLAAKVELPLMLLNAALVEGEPLDWQPPELERIILASADAHRSGGGMALSPVRVLETQTLALVWHDGEFREARAGDVPDANALIGPSAAGAFVRVDLVPERTPTGPSVAPRVARALSFLDAHLGLGIGPLVPARDVRASE